MSALSIRRGRPVGSARMAAYGAAGIGFGLLGWLVAGLPDTALVPLTAVLAGIAAVSLVIAAMRHGLMTSPLILLGVPLLLSLAAAMLPITRIYGDWSLENLTTAIFIIVAPLAGVGAAMLTTQARTLRLQRKTDAEPRPRRLIAAILFMCFVGTAVYAYEWSGVGGPPLLSPDIDEARFGIEFGLVHVLTQGMPLALIIATWARVGRPDSFTVLQRRVLVAIMCYVPIILALGGGRALVIIPLISALVVAARHVSARAARRMAIVIPVAILVFSSTVFLTRIEQRTATGVAATVLYSEDGSKNSPFESAYRILSINLGEQLRVISELREAGIRTPPFTSSIWFAHNVAGRAVDPETVTAPNAAGWLTSMYAGPLLLDFGLLPALLFGFALGAGAQVLYRRFARGQSATIIWVYAYLAGPLALAFYLNIFLYFVFPILDVLALLILARLLIRPAGKPAAETRPQAPGEATASVA